MALYCTVAKPTRELFSGEVHYASIPGVDGSLGVLPGHELLVTLNRAGGLLTLNIDPEGKDVKKILIFKGVTSVLDDKVTILPRFAIYVDEIDTAIIRTKQEALKTQVAELEKEGTDDGSIGSELETSRLKLEWYQAQLDYVEGSTK